MKYQYIAVGLVLGLLSGCSSPLDKVNKIMAKRMSTCKTSTTDFAEIELFEGNDTILKDACDLEVTNVKMSDDYHAMASTGPYDWLFGVDTETGVWVLTQVRWEVLSQAIRNMSGDDPPVDSLERADKELAEATKAMPDNRWIRVTRAKNALNIRNKRRGKDKVAPFTLGDSKAAFEESLTWAKGKDKTATAMIQLAYLDHYGAYNHKLELALEYLGSQDDAYEASIRQAVKDKDEKTIKNYTEELEKMRAERPALRATLYERLGKIFDTRCATIGELNQDGVEDEETRKALVAAQKSMDCKPASRPKLPAEESE